MKWRGGGSSIEITYAWFDTGLEYQATKDHLAYLEDRYDITIERMRPVKSIPTCVREFGQPFLSKIVSERIQRLQRYDFQWEDEPFEVLAERYPNCTSSLRWWTNTYTRIPGEPGQYDIGRSRWLKEFMVLNPPTFKVSNLCCEYTKKRVAKHALKQLECDLDVIGVRKSEGGIRASGNTCFTASYTKTGVDKYRPLFWLDDGARREYVETFGIRHSDCYTEYGFKRTGCAGCPYNRRFDSDNAITEVYEPKLHKAICNLFKESYEYTRQYREFQREHDSMQMTIDLGHART